LHDHRQAARVAIVDHGFGERAGRRHRRAYCRVPGAARHHHRRWTFDRMKVMICTVDERSDAAASRLSARRE
jgi:hypothetical protein